MRWSWWAFGVVVMGGAAGGRHWFAGGALGIESVFTDRNWACDVGNDSLFFDAALSLPYLALFMEFILFKPCFFPPKSPFTHHPEYLVKTPPPQASSAKRIRELPNRNRAR